MDGLEAFITADFDWVVKTDGVWRDTDFDVRDIHADLKSLVLEEIERLKAKKTGESPLGWVFLGEGGAGKTHLLRSLRREVVDRDATFFMADLTEVKDFWETVLLAMLSSLHRTVRGDVPQYQLMCEKILELVPHEQDPRTIIKLLSVAPAEKVIAFAGNLNRLLRRSVNARNTVRFQDVIRSLVYLNADDFSLVNLANGWLQGLELDEADRSAFQYASKQNRRKDIIEGLTWIAGLRGPVVLALDNLDTIVHEHHVPAEEPVGGAGSEEAPRSSVPIEQIAGGLAALIQNVTHRTLVLVSCLESTWYILGRTLDTHTDRFKMPRLLKAIYNTDHIKEIVRKRLENAYRLGHFTPPYPTWPFTNEFFKEMHGAFPREVLRKCEEHRFHCEKGSRVVEVSSLKDIVSSSDSEHNNHADNFDEKLDELAGKTPLLEILDEEQEDGRLGTLLVAAGECLIRENADEGGVKAEMETNIPEGNIFPHLHVRLRLIHHEGTEPDKCLCLRAIQKSNANAFQTRLKAAANMAELNNDPSRKLLIVRTHPVYGGEKTQDLVEQLKSDGVHFIQFMENDIRTLWALGELLKEPAPGFDQWLCEAKPVSKLSPFRQLVTWLYPKEKTESEEGTGDPGPQPPTEDAATDDPARGIPVGARIVDDRIANIVYLPLEMIPHHLAVMAGAATGKTMLVRRLVEEAALMGIPAIVLDSANKLANIGEPWPTPPPDRKRDDPQKADTFSKIVETRLWTPGRQDGNPLPLEPIPDLTEIMEKSEIWFQAMQMILRQMETVLEIGNEDEDQERGKLLSDSLARFINDGSHGFMEFIDYLDNNTGSDKTSSKSAELVEEMVLQFRNTLKESVLFRDRDRYVEPEELFGSSAHTESTRISVINTAGLSEPKHKKQFLNQLILQIYTWLGLQGSISSSGPLRGLFVIDDAGDYIPMNGSGICTESLLQLLDLGRKNGLGIIFTAQAPLLMNREISDQCAFHCFGQANSPRAIAAIKEQVVLRGGAAERISSLGTGRFLMLTDQDTAWGGDGPMYFRAPPSITHHSPYPMDMDDIIEKAAMERVRSQGSK